MVEIVIVGAGMAGLACARRLALSGYRPLLIDKGRGAGGRMASRRVSTACGELRFDHGAQYFTAHEPAFQSQVELWTEAGDVARWTAAGEEAWVGTPAMNAPLKALTRSLDVRWTTRVTRMERAAERWSISTDANETLRADALVLALPAEQAADLLESSQPAFAARARAVVSAPCWTVMLAFAERLATAEDCIRGRDEDAVGWAARNSSKPGRGPVETWVVQAGADWSRRHLEAAPVDVEAALMDELTARLGFVLPTPIFQSSHRWRFARSGADGSMTLWDPELNLGVCGDWLLGPRVENAWLSGTRLGEALAVTLASKGSV